MSYVRISWRKRLWLPVSTWERMERVRIKSLKSPARMLIRPFADYMYAYSPTQWDKLDGTSYGPAENFLVPSQNVTINGIPDYFSERNADRCTPWRVDPPGIQPFDFGKILIVGNGQCASACALFTSIMQELHGVKVANFGAAKKSHSGMAAGIVLNWSVLDSEVKVSPYLFHADGIADSPAIATMTTRLRG